jgi:poly(3-hydroxybutyrate) depolymerase
MAALFEIVVQGQRRSFILEMCPDWMIRLAANELTLVVGLHGGAQAAEEFYDGTEMDALLSGLLTGTPEHVVALFPRGLCTGPDGTHAWKNGHMGEVANLHPYDDVLFVKEAIVEVDRILTEEYTRLSGGVAPPSPFFYRMLLVGFSNGGQFALRCSADLDRFDGQLPWGGAYGTVMPNVIAVAECTAGGCSYVFESVRGDPVDFTFNDAMPGIVLEHLNPGRQPPNLIQTHSIHDTSIAADGGISAESRTNADEDMNGNGDGYYQWDLPSGVRPIDRGNPRPPLKWTGATRSVKHGIVPWLPDRSDPAFAVVYTPLDPLDPLRRNFDQWSWQIPGVREARFLLSNTNRGGVGHVWPGLSDGWSFTLQAWEMLDQYYP